MTTFTATDPVARRLQRHRRLRRGLLLSLGLALGCRPDAAPRIAWLQRASYREIDGIDLAPDGGVVVVGHSTSDEVAQGQQNGQYTYRPFAARVGPDGDVQWTYTGFTGLLEDVAVDPRGNAHAIFTAAAPEAWDSSLVVFDPSGTTTTERRWYDADGLRAGPYGVAMAGERVVVGANGGTEGLNADGSTAWHIELSGKKLVPGPDASVVLMQEVEGGVDVWRVREDGLSTRVLAARDHRQASYDLFTANDALVLVEYVEGPWTSTPPPQGPIIVALYDGDGALRWRDEYAGVANWYRTVVAVVPKADGGLVVVEKVEPDPINVELGARVDMRRFHADGRRESTLSFSLPERWDDVQDVVPCPLSDAEEYHYGTRPVAALRREDGTMILAGMQHCRHAWIAAMEVP